MNGRAAGVLLSVVLSALALGACSGADSPSAAEQCLTYQSTYCAKAVECAVSTDRSDFGETCDFEWRVYSVCDRVQQVTPQYSSCIQAIQSIACQAVPSGSFPEFPAQCRGIFVVSP